MSQRLRFSEDERIHPWLPILLDVLYLCDKANEELMASCARKKIQVACSKGCDACCRNQTIKVTDLELSGISWYVMEKMDKELRAVVKEQLLVSASSISCPFLVDGACAVYPVRPLTCRQFFVKDTPCAIDENVNKTRPGDIIIPSPESVIKLSLRLLDFWNITRKNEKSRALANGFIFKQMRPMHTVDWVSFAKGIDAPASPTDEPA